MTTTTRYAVERMAQLGRKSVRGMNTRALPNELAKGPKPAKSLEYMWFIGTTKPPQAWPKKFGNTVEQGDPVDRAVDALTLRGEQVAVFHDDDQGRRQIGSFSQIWVFCSKWGETSRHYWDVSDVELVREDVLRNLDTPGKECELDSKPVYFVCGHGTRDQRCGVKGEAVFKELRKNNHRAYLCSHIGGHAFAGNVIALPKAAWFSMVDDKNVDEMITGKCSSVICRGCSW